MSIWDDFVEPISDAVDAIGDAGDLVGGILKSISPLLGAIPGLGTAFAVALYAAGAIAAKDRITDAAIGTVGAAMPPGIPQIAFNGAVEVTRSVAAGRSVEEATLSTCREIAAKAGGEPAVAAFDSGLAMLRGGPVDQRLIDQGRHFALTGGGTIGAASYDAAIALAQGRDSEQAVIASARGYIKDMGGNAAIAAFDTALALCYGKSLQEAGYLGLHTFVRGNDGVEKVLNFLEQVGRAARAGVSVRDVLEGELTTDFLHALSATGVHLDASSVVQSLAPYLDAIRQDFGVLEYPAGELARRWGVDEAIAREAQALMRAGNGQIDLGMLDSLKFSADVTGQGSFDFSERNERSKQANDALAARGQELINSGAEWFGTLLSDIRRRETFAMHLMVEDPLTHITSRQLVKWNIEDRWRRGFDVGLGTAEGTSADSSEQVRANLEVRQRLPSRESQGFDAGEGIQLARTRFSRRFQGTDALSASSVLNAAAALPAPDAATRTHILPGHPNRQIDRSASEDPALNDPTSGVARTKWQKLLKKSAETSRAIAALPVPVPLARAGVRASAATGIQAAAHAKPTPGVHVLTKAKHSPGAPRHK